MANQIQINNQRSTSGTNERHRLLGYQEATDQYGATIWFWRDLVWKGELPVLKVGNKHLLDRADIEEFIQKHKEQHRPPASIANKHRKERALAFCGRPARAVITGKGNESEKKQGMGSIGARRPR